MELNNHVQQRNTAREMDSLEEMATQPQDVSLMMKLEQLRKWQQHMQEQLKAHQLEELLRLEEEQQRLLAMMNTHNAEEMSEAEWGEDTHHSSTTNCQSHTTAVCCGLPGEQHVLPTEEQKPLLKVPNTDVIDNDEEGLSYSRDDEQDQSHDSMLTAQNQMHPEQNSRQEETSLLDRPIKPGIGGRMQTFEELVEEQLRLKEQRLQSVQHKQIQPRPESVCTHPKRPFLKRGEGLLRFTQRKSALQMADGKMELKPQSQMKGIIRNNSEPASFRKIQTNPVQNPVQRKTVTLNKENRSNSLLAPDSKAARLKVLGSHQRRNMPKTSTVQFYPEEQQTKPPLEPAAVKIPNIRNTRGEMIRPTALTKEIHCNRNTEDEPTTNSGPRITQRQNGKYSLDLSFQERLQRWECDSQLESVELGEFELLEQAAEELSFSSNSSFVMKVLQLDLQRQIQGAKALHQRRLSSTPIKFPPPEQRRSSGTTSNPSLMDSSVVLKGNTEMDVADENNQDIEMQENSVSDASSWGESEIEEHDTEVKVTSVTNVLQFSVQSNPPYDKRSYQVKDSRKGSNSSLTQSENAVSDGDLSNSEDCTLTEDKEDQQGKVVFDDDDTWNELEESVVKSHERSFKETSKSEKLSPPERTVTRKVAVTKTMGADKQLDRHPVSQLMTRLFPLLKTNSENAPVIISSVVEPRKDGERTAPVPQAQSQLLRDRLVELETEIEHFKKENAALTKLRQENEKIRENLRKECIDFEQMKSQEMARVEEYKREETRKLQRERKLFEKHISAARAIPNKNERDEIQALKQLLSCLKEELRKKESRWTTTHSRLRQQIEALGKDNSALREEVRTLEALRITAWKKNSFNAEKDKASLTKGVKFTTPLDSSSSSTLQSSPTITTTRGSSREPGAGTAAVTTMIKSNLRRPSLNWRRSEEAKPIKQAPEQSKVSPEQSQQTESIPDASESSQDVITHPDGKVEKVLSGGERLIVFRNGTKKEVSADGLTVKVTFFNGDTKQLTTDQRVIYYYADAKTTHITYPDGMEVLHFPNNQTEKHFPDGHKEITFPDQTVKNLYPNGREESVLTDGTIILVNPDGSKEILFNTGQKEVHTAEYKRREYPDGTVKTVYSDGQQETRYPTGRLRIKDKDGNVMLDNWP